MDSYKDYPVTVGEQRAANNNELRDWSPRDLLICMLRDIDSGLRNPTDVVLCYAEGEAEGGYMRAGQNPETHISHLEIAKHRIIDDMFSKTRR